MTLTSMEKQCRKDMVFFIIFLGIYITVFVRASFCYNAWTCFSSMKKCDLEKTRAESGKS